MNISCLSGAILTTCKRGAFFTLLSGTPSKDRVDFWQMRTMKPFDYSVDGVGAMTKKILDCPSCSCTMTVGE